MSVFHDMNFHDLRKLELALAQRDKMAEALRAADFMLSALGCPRDSETRVMIRDALPDVVGTQSKPQEGS